MPCQTVDLPVSPSKGYLRDLLSHTFLYNETHPAGPDGTGDRGRSRALDQLLLAEGINPNEVIVSRNGTLIPEDTVVGGDDEIRLIRIAHGG